MALYGGYPSYQPMYQPYSQQGQQNGIIWVTGEAGAKAYLVLRHPFRVSVDTFFTKTKPESLFSVESLLTALLGIR